MAQFNSFAYYYDKLNVNYENQAIADRLTGLLTGCRDVVDLCCGTGDIAIALRRLGFSVTGVDISTDMLNVAVEKSRKSSAQVQFVCSDARKLMLPHKVDAVYSMCDGMNYMMGAPELEKAFSSIYGCLQRNGLFIFDISTQYKYLNLLANNAFVFDFDDIFLTWQNEYDKQSKVCRMDITGFVKDVKGNTYTRFDETHTQYSFTEEEVRQMLQKTGFEIKNVYSGYTTSAVKQNDERIFFVAQKRS